MKIPKEYFFLTIVGLLLLAYVLEAVVDPLALKLATPYNYLSPEVLTKYPFSTAVILLRSIGLTLIPILIFNFFNKGYGAKFIISLLISGLTQLYAVQEVATGTTLAPLEWSLSLAVMGIFYIFIALVFLVLNISQVVKNKIDDLTDQPQPDESN
ncbi:hypothetical protein A2572_03830 [Candidatus Collierbacteria bacterium RIFOXYD1_FULL_40_9]|uniref:Uncharacterized protein n=1 Tax=Candidatus Collierbacteria bacterium RIFOXYD1_FULL_40_9 TaxID=1817731 RepID=A0A1F5FU60_9BACT|nr:MAG: hypothetical protein A2572_03830 [Candidatus Collierbacteria bacterium RIFOXYD1_FULL_40_9]